MQQTTKMTNHFLKSKFLMVPSLNRDDFNKEKTPTDSFEHHQSEALNTFLHILYDEVVELLWSKYFSPNVCCLLWQRFSKFSRMNDSELWLGDDNNIINAGSVHLYNSQQVSDIWSAWASFSGVSVYFLCLLRFPVFMGRIYLNYHVFWHSHTLYINYGCNYLWYRPLVCGLIILKQ